VLLQHVSPGRVDLKLEQSHFHLLAEGGRSDTPTVKPLSTPDNGICSESLKLK